MDTGQILVMRHAEKSADPLDPNLSQAGRERAQKLASYIPNSFGKPDFLFATAASKHSLRPIQTLQPLSNATGVQIDSSFADQDYGALAYEIQNKPQYDGKRIVVCWHHGNIPSLARALKAQDGDYPDPWNHETFNLILRFDFTHGVPNVQRIIEPF